jgi:hypothetical protein
VGKVRCENRRREAAAPYRDEKQARKPLLSAFNPESEVESFNFPFNFPDKLDRYRKTEITA